MRKILILFFAAVLLAGCTPQEDPYRVDTVIRIPLHPEEVMTPVSTAAPEPATEPENPTLPTVPQTEAPTEPAKKPAPSGGKAPSHEEDATVRQTNPPETVPPQTMPAQSQPPTTEPPATEPSAAEPPATDAPATKPPSAEDSRYDISGYAAGALEYAIRDEINGLRAGEGSPELGMDGWLCAVASCRGWEISRLWSHTRPDGRDYATVLSDYGYGAGDVRELLVYVTGSVDGAAVVAQWAASDSHRKLLLDERWDTVGIGVFRENGYTYICVLLVC